MKIVISENKKLRLLTGLAAAFLLVAGSASEIQAQWSTKWLAVGDFHHPYLSGGAEPEALADETIWFWPGIHPGTGHSRWKALWISTLDFTDESGQHWPVRTSHIGPRVLGIGEMFDVEHNLIARFDAPVVRVDGFDTFHRPTFVDEVDPNLEADRIVNNVVNTSVGITMQRRAMQFSQDYHDSYHLIEYTFTNTGHVNRENNGELADQTLEGVYFVFNDHATVNAPAGGWDNSAGGTVWGQYTMNDAVGDGFEDYGVDFRAQFSWLGHVPERSNFSALGNPMWTHHQWYSVQGDTMGRLAGAQMVGTVTIHADGEAGPAGQTQPDDREQPRLMTYIEHDWSEMTTGNDHNDLAKMQFERGFIERGAFHSSVAPEGSDPRVVPTHAYLVQPDGDFTYGTNDPSMGRAGGWAYVNGYGPYTMAPGDQVRIVVAEGVAGLSEEAKYRIGRAYKRSVWNDQLEIPFDANGNGVIDPDEIMTKNEWVMTTRDSLFQLFHRAIDNYESGYNIPLPPLPPSRFEVTSGTDEIRLEWDAFPGQEPPHGWEIWRAEKDYHGIVTALRVVDGRAVPDSSRAYQLIHEATPDVRSYTDRQVERGLSYFYYLQAVGDFNEDATGLTPTGVRLKSSRYYTQTYEPAFLRRAPGATLSDIVVVPNPYNLASDTDVRFGDQQDKIAFYGLPAEATIRIYTEIGELVATIEHSDGSGDAFWDLTTTSRQVIVSGVYAAVIENRDPNNPEFGDRIIRKIIIIR